MAAVDFGIIREMDADRDYSVFESYRAVLAEFECVSVCDEVAERWFERLADLPVSYSSLRRRGRGPDPCGVNLISHQDVPALLCIVREDLRGNLQGNQREDQADDLSGEGAGCGRSDCSFERGRAEALVALLEEIIRTGSYLVCFGI